MLLTISPILFQNPPIPFLGSSLAFVMVYIWSRRNKFVRLNLFGVVIINAPYLPFTLCAFSWMITGGNSHAVKGDLLGLLVGHIYYFFADVWPKEIRSGGRQLVRTPKWFTRVIQNYLGE
ncbi:unnamed protein product [Sympodiomycopsis kandeliae]